MGYISGYADLSWVREHAEEVEYWKSLFMEWSEANTCLARLWSGEKDVDLYTKLFQSGNTRRYRILKPCHRILWWGFNFVVTKHLAFLNIYRNNTYISAYKKIEMRVGFFENHIMEAKR